MTSRARSLRRALAAAAAVAGLAACGPGAGEEHDGEAHVEPVHVHGLALVDGALLIATHNGLFRLEPDAQRAEVVGDTRHDLMGFTALAPDRFLASGHPDLGDHDLPPHLGLIESRDGGETWQSVSLLGQADFHVLRAAGDRVYGFDATHGRLLASGDGGRSWSDAASPGAVVDLAIDPADPEHLLASAEDGLHESRDGARTWERVGDGVGLLAWPEGGPPQLVAGDGAVSRLSAGGWRRVGSVGGHPAAFTAAGPRELVVALHDGAIVASSDGGAAWTTRLGAR